MSSASYTEITKTVVPTTITSLAIDNYYYFMYISNTSTTDVSCNIYKYDITANNFFVYTKSNYDIFDMTIQHINYQNNVYLFVITKDPNNVIYYVESKDIVSNPILNYIEPYSYFQNFSSNYPNFIGISSDIHNNLYLLSMNINNKPRIHKINLSSDPSQIDLSSTITYLDKNITTVPQSVTVDDNYYIYISYSDSTIIKYNTDITTHSLIFDISFGNAVYNNIFYDTYTSRLYASDIHNIYAFDVCGNSVAINTNDDMIMNVGSGTAKQFNRGIGIYHDVFSGDTKKLFVSGTNLNNNYQLFQMTFPACFNEGTKLLCLNSNEEEEYIPIEQLKKGDYIKSYQHGYRKIDLIGKGKFVNDPNKFNHCMYLLPKNECHGPFEDLILTGGHSILVDDLGSFEEENDKYFGKTPKIDDKYLLLACVSTDFKKLDNNNQYTYYHLTLENDGNDDDRYGIWANGILTETPSKNSFKTYFSHF